MTDQTDIQKVHELVFDTNKRSEICSILRRGYFRRRWVIQEATLAHNILDNCGRYRLSWQTFVRAVAVLRSVVTLIPPVDVTMSWLYNMPHAPAFSLVTTRTIVATLAAGSAEDFVARLCHLS